MKTPSFDYQIVVSGDGSPTLSLGPTWEHMHALEGAFTETQYIYQPTIAKAFEAVAHPVFLSLGLGIAYNEILIAFEAIHRKQMPELIASYESIAGLRHAFTEWLQERPSVLASVYDQILELYAQRYAGEKKEAKALLRELYQNGKLQVLGAVEKEIPPVSHSILFDAFSNKTSPELWDETFLGDFFARSSAQPCFVSTYACNGSLKRALKKNAFVLTILKGFGKKRQSLFAHRN